MKVALPVRVNDNTLAKLKAFAAKKNKSLSFLVNDILTQYQNEDIKNKQLS